MMEQYRSIKATLPPETILFYRLGDFYEMFFEDAQRASEILQITLTGRDGGPAGRVPMCGVPYHSYASYVRTLLDHNLKVALCEQIGDPALSKGLVERRVTRIITPATYLDEETGQVAPEYLVAVSGGAEGSGLAALNLSTGEFFVRELPRENILQELALLNPREVVFPKGLAQDPALTAFVKETLCSALAVYEEWIFEPAQALRLLQEELNLASPRSIAFHERALAVSAAGAVLYYLKAHLSAPTAGQPADGHSPLGHIRMPVFQEAQAFMALDRQTLRSLEVVSNLREGTKAGTLFGTLDRTLTPMGGRTLYHWLLHPLRDLSPILERQEGTACFAENPRLTQAVRSSLKGIRDVERTVSRLNLGVGNARDLLNLRFFLERLPALATALGTPKAPILERLLREMPAFSDLQDLIARAIVEMPPVSLREGGLIRDGYAERLDHLRNLSRRGKSWLMEFQQREIQRTGIKSLRIRYNQLFGYSIEVSKPNLRLVPPEYVRRQTLANAERFVVPELTEWNEKISGAQEEIQALEYELFMEIRRRVLERLSDLQAAARAVGVLDALAALGETALRHRWVRPILTESRQLKIQGGRHPVLETLLPAGQFVENDAYLDGEQHQLLVLTGPNMAGKSTYIRQVALIVLLAQMGAFVPARCARLGLVDRIFTRIGARDDLAHGESTFMVEMIEMAQILQGATDRSLLILDEVGRGTSTFDGVSLAWAICEHLVRGVSRPRTLFATHYHELTQLEQEFAAVKNYTITVRETPRGIVFLRRVVPGGSDRSYGIQVAKLAGIPPSVIGRAAQILRVLEAESAEATRRIEGKMEIGTRCQGRTSVPGADSKHPVLEAIAQLSLEDLTPLEALNLLGQYQQQLEGRSGGKNPRSA